MAAADKDIADLAASLSVEETPVKLRCATCSQIAYNALRLPCCEQNICENCYNDLEDMCQVCHHEPLDKSLCAPNKSLRTTTKVFLKKKLFERGKDQKKKDDVSVKTESKAENSAEMLPNAGTLGSSAAGAQIVKETHQLPTKDLLDKPSGEVATEPETSVSDSKLSGPVAAKLSAEGNYQEPSATENVEDAGQRNHGEDESGHAQEATEQGLEGDAGDEQWQSNDMAGMMNGAFNGMSGGFPMDFNQMMASGMQMPGAGFPNMMGMGMDSNMMNQMSQSMFGGFGGPNMGMGGMGANMGMGFNGQGQYRGWYNGNGGNAGFGGQSGYNMSHQGNFNQMNQQQYHNDYSNGYGRHGFHGRGGRGRRGGYYNGGFGRNYYGHNHSGYANHASNYAYQQQSNQAEDSAPTHAGADSVNVSGEPLATTKDEEARMIKELAPGNEDDNARVESEQVTTHNATGRDDSGGPNDNDSKTSNAEQLGNDSEQNKPSGKPTERPREEEKLLPIQSFVSDEPRHGRGVPPLGPNVPQGPSGRGFGRGSLYSSNGPANVPVASEPKGLGVVGAPTGPKALREGLPNTARSAFLARPPPPPAPIQTVQESKPLQSPIPTPRKSQSRSRSRSPSRHHSDRQRSSRHRSRSKEPEEKYDDRDDRRHKRSRHYDEDERPEDEELSRRSSHRSRRHHDRESDSSNHKRHRERSHEREKDKDRYREHDREYERERDRNKDREYNDERRHRRRRSRSSPDPAGSNSASVYPTNGEEGSRKRRTRDDDYNKSHDYDKNHDYDKSYDRGHDRKRSRRDQSVSAEHHTHHHHSLSRDDSKPSTPATPSFPTTSRRQSEIGIGVPGAPSGPSKPIPTGPKASFPQTQNHRRADRDRDRDRDREHHRRPSDRTNGSSVEDPKTQDKDPHTLEREARDRERLMKEMQRRATMEGPKRGSKGGVNIRGSARRSSIKYEDEEGDEARRIEREREAGRWK